VKKNERVSEKTFNSCMQSHLAAIDMPAVFYSGILGGFNFSNFRS